MNPGAKRNDKRRKKKRRETLGGSVERVAAQDNSHARNFFHLHELYRARRCGGGRSLLLRGVFSPTGFSIAV